MTSIEVMQLVEGWGCNTPNFPLNCVTSILYNCASYLIGFLWLYVALGFFCDINVEYLLKKNP